MLPRQCGSWLIVCGSGEWSEIDSEILPEKLFREGSYSRFLNALLIYVSDRTVSQRKWVQTCRTISIGWWWGESILTKCDVNMRSLIALLMFAWNSDDCVFPFDPASNCLNNEEQNELQPMQPINFFKRETGTVDTGLTINFLRSQPRSRNSGRILISWKRYETE